MKIRELIEHLKGFNGELEIYKFNSELNEYFPLEIEEIGKSELYLINDSLVPVDEIQYCLDDNEEEFDDNKVKKVFII